MLKQNLSQIPLSFRFAAIGLFIFTIVACSSKNIPVIYYNNFDFSQVNNYSFYNSGSAFIDSQNLSYAQRSRIELAIEKSLSKQALSYSKIERADIIVTYHLVNKNPKDYQSYNKLVRFCRQCLNANLWIKNNQKWQAYPGGLIIDLVNPTNNRSVWRSIYPLNYDVKDNSKTLNAKIMNAVDIMLEKYPENI